MSDTAPAPKAPKAAESCAPPAPQRPEGAPLTPEQIIQLFDELSAMDPEGIKHIWLPQFYLDARELIQEPETAAVWSPDFGKPVLRPMTNKEKVQLRVRQRKAAEAAARAASSETDASGGVTGGATNDSTDGATGAETSLAEAPVASDEKTPE